MNIKNAQKIIKGYKPHKGFFDLSNCPKTLSKIDYAKILEAQNFIAEQNQNRKYLRKFNKLQWEKLMELSAELQIVILQHWGNNIFNQTCNSKARTIKAKED